MLDVAAGRLPKPIKRKPPAQGAVGGSTLQGGEADDEEEAGLVRAPSGEDDDDEDAESVYGIFDGALASPEAQMQQFEEDSD